MANRDAPAATPEAPTGPSTGSAPVPAFALDRLSVSVGSGEDRIQLISDVTLSVNEGECLGVVGESGCGKTVSFLGALGLLPAAILVGGSVRLGGQEILGLGEPELQAIRGRRVGMIFQDPQSGLNPVRTIGRQLMEPLRLHMRLTGAAAKARAIDLLSLVGIPAPRDRLHAYPHEISGGMCQRVMIAMALASEPKVLIADEPTTALDATVQLEVLDLLRTIQNETQLAIIFITHDLGIVSEICDRLTIMYAGRSVETQSIPAAFQHPLHPYAAALLQCLPSVEPGGPPPACIPGEVPVPGRVPDGCSFHPRCAFADQTCRAQSPPSTLRGPTGARVACHHPLGKLEGRGS